MSLTAMDAPKPMRQPASTEKNGPKTMPNRRYSRPATSNQSGQSYPATVGPTGSTQPVATNPNRSQPAAAAAKTSLLQASILVAPFAGAESCPKVHRTTRQSERPASGNARTNFWEEDGRPEGREQEVLGAGRGK